MSQARVLIVDDDPGILQVLPEALRLRMNGVTVDVADSAAFALEQIDARDYDAIVTDIKMPGMDGLALLAEIRTRRPDTPTLMITGHGEHDLVAHSLRGGAYDFIEEPIDGDYLVASLIRAIQMREVSRRAKEQQVTLERHPNELEERARDLREKNKVIKSPLRFLMSPGGQMEKIVQQIEQVADSPLTVLIQGETGTGKELVARAIHQLSSRREKPFVAVDCGAIPDTLIESELYGYEKGAFTGAHQRKAGQFQLAEGGTLFLDEIVNLPLLTQVKLLRAVQERQVQPLGGKQLVRVGARIVAASNVPIESEVRAGRFRQDVYYRLNEFGITLPPLRERNDILYLANEFLREASVEFGRPCGNISEAAGDILLRYHWPGNVRELRNVLERTVYLAQAAGQTELDLVSLPTAAQAGGEVFQFDPARSYRETRAKFDAEFERRYVKWLLGRNAGNVSAAAREAKMDRKHLHDMAKKHGLRGPEHDDES